MAYSLSAGDCALFCLLGLRLEEKYRAMERLGVVADDLTGVVQFLSGFKYSPNPKAKDFNLMSVLKYIESATRREETVR